MNKLKFLILELLSANPGKSYSIRQLTAELSKKGEKAHYSRIYEELTRLEQEKTIKFLNIGKSKIPKLNLTYETTKKLAQLELEKINYLNFETKKLLEKIEANYWKQNVDSISLINYKKFKGLNYFELLIILNDEIGAFVIHEAEELDNAEQREEEKLKETLKDRTTELFKFNSYIEKITDAKINALILLKKKEFIPKISTNEFNATRECFLEHLSFNQPDRFWDAILMSNYYNHQIPKINPMKKLTENEINYFLNKLGFELFTNNQTIHQDNEISIEFLIAEILGQDNARWMEGIPIIISKNLEKINFKELIFLTKRKNKINQLGFLLETMKEIIKDEDKKNNVKKALKWLEFLKSKKEEQLIEGIKTTKKQERIAKKWFIKTNYSFEEFKKRMREYNAD